MNVKIKIALNGIAQKLSRQSITPEQAAAHFKKVTGENLADYVAQADPEVGKFLAYLEGAYPVPAAQVSESEPAADLQELPTDFSAKNPNANPDLVALAQDAFQAVKIHLSNIQQATGSLTVGDLLAAPQDPEAEAPTAPQDPEADEPTAPQDPETEAPAAPQDPETEAPAAPQDPEAAPAVTEERPKRTRKPAEAK